MFFHCTLLLQIRTSRTRLSLLSPYPSHYIASANVVGYFQKEQKAFVDDIPAPAGIITFQWDSIGGLTKDINEALTCPEEIAVASYPEGEFDEDWINKAVEIEIRQPNGDYTILYWCSDAYDGEDTKLGWADADGNLATGVEVSLGQGAWVFAHGADAQLTMSGEVAAEEVSVGGNCKTEEGTGVYLLGGASFPVKFDVNDADVVTWTATAATSYPEGEFDENWINKASEIEIRQDNGDYTILYWCNDAYDGEDTKLGWADADGNLAENAIVDVGGGFWMNTPVDDADGKRLFYCTVKNPIQK